MLRMLSQVRIKPTTTAERPKSSSMGGIRLLKSGQITLIPKKPKPTKNVLPYGNFVIIYPPEMDDALDCNGAYGEVQTSGEISRSITLDNQDRHGLESNQMLTSRTVRFILFEYQRDKWSAKFYLRLF
jgi:hypothetical protein